MGNTSKALSIFMTQSEAKHTFADLMAKARTRPLTPTDKRQLTVARQMLRRGKRPAMNPPPYVKLRDLPMGAMFEFEAIDKFPYSGMAQGPWIKTGSNKYRDANEQIHQTRYGKKDLKGSGLAKVFKVTPDVKGPLFGNPRQMLRRAKRPAMNPRLHWTENQQWKEHKTGETVTAEELLKRYGDYLRVHRISLIDRPKDFSVRMDDGTVWSRTTDLRQNPLTHKKARRILHEGRVRGRKLTPSQRGFFGARASGYPRRSNPKGAIVRLGRAEEVRYHRNIGSQPGYYKHEIRSRKAGVYTIPAGWVHVSSKSILITEGEPRA